MEDIKGLIEKVESSEEFKEIKDKVYLCSFFRMFDKKTEILQIHYYNKEKDNIISFIMENNKVRTEESKVFREKDEPVEELSLEEIKITQEQALDKFDKLIKEKYKGEYPQKKIVILQKVKVPLWNLTYLSDTFNIINIKMDAKSGEILSEDLSSALNLGTRQ